MEKRLNISTFHRLISSIYGITLCVFDSGGQLIEQHASDPAIADFLLNFANLKTRILQLCGQHRLPRIISSELGQLWAGIPVRDTNQLKQLIVLGPVFTSGGSTQLMRDYVRAYNISTTPREKLVDALNHTPICAYAEFTRVVAVLYAFIYEEELDTSELPIAGLTQHENPAVPALRMEEISAARSENAPDPTYTLGQHLLECVQEGDLEKLKRLLKTFNYAQIHYLSLPDPIRQQKDMFISLISQVINAAIQAGLNPDLTYSLYDRYIQQVETMTNVLPIISLTREMLYDYTSRAGRLKRTRQYSKLINDCCNYINGHIDENLRVSDVAAFAGRNAHYIAQKFREETGQTISDYIRAAKISEAKSLLKYSTLSLADISEQLAFSSQSYFTAAFRQATGITPGQFRENTEM